MVSAGLQSSLVCCLALAILHPAEQTFAAPRETPTDKRVKAYLDAVPAIDTHDHLWPFETLPGYVETDRGHGMNLSSLWRNSYYSWINPITAWKAGGAFDEWWVKAREDFQNARGTSFYRYQLPAFEDLYGIDFDRITDAQARELNDRIFKNYQDQKWLYHVVTERANIELMFNDPYWARLKLTTYYPFEVLVFNVTTLVRGFHASEFSNPWDSPYRFAGEEGLEMKSLWTTTCSCSTGFFRRQRPPARRV